MASEKPTGCKSCLEEDIGPDLPSFRLVSQNHDRHGCGVPSLSIDSGTCSVEPCHMLESSEDFTAENRAQCDCTHTNGFSEEELLNITFEACDTTGKGEVQASTVVQYLQAMTLQSSGQDKLTNLRHMLDPENQDSPVSRDVFHATMREWIAQCCQDGAPDDKNQATGIAPISGSEYHLPLNEATFTDGAACHCESGDLSGLVAELKHTQHRLSEQNSSLLRTVSQCEDTILQLSLEVSELHTKLASTQLFVVRARSLSEELDETRCALRESQERAARAQTSNCALIKECERLKALIKKSEEKNEKLTLEKNLAEDRINKFREENSELRGELEESHMVLAVKDRDLTKKSILLEKLRDTHFESHKIIEGLQSELMRLQEHSQQALFRLNKYNISSRGPQRTSLINHQSLHHEIQEAQPSQNVSVELISGSLNQILPTVTQRRDIQSFQKVKPAELSHILHAQLSEPDKVGNSAREKLHRLYLQDQQQHEHSGQELVTLLKELELLEASLEAQGQHKAKHQTQKAHVAAVITWWKGQTKERKKNQSVHGSQEAASDMQKWTQSLEIDRSRVILKDQGTSTCLDSPIQFRDVAVITDSSDEHLATEDLLKSLRKVEDMVAQALRAAQVLMGGEKRMKKRIETISMRVERALSKAEATESQINALEATISANKQPLCASQSVATGIEEDCSSPAVMSVSTQVPVTQESTLTPFSSENGGSLLYTRAEDHSNKVSKRPDDTVLDQDSGSPSELLLKRPDSVCSEPVSAGLPYVGAISLQSTFLLCAKSSSPEPSACEEPTPHNRQENVAGLNWPENNDSFVPESTVSWSTFALNKETCRIPNKEEAGCPGTELQRGQVESSGRCQEYSSRTEALKLLNQGELFKSEDDWDNHGFSSSAEAQVEDTGRCQEGTEESDCTGRSQEESECCGKSQARTGNSETHEGPKTSDSNTSRSVQTAYLADTPEDQEDPPAVCQFPSSRGEDSSLRRAPSFVTESVPPFIFPHTRSRPPLTPAMPTLPEEEEDSPEELDSTSSSPSSYAPVESKMMNVIGSPPAIVLPRQVSKQDSCPLEKARSHSPRPRLSRNSPSSCPITTVGDDGHVIDLVKDPLPELQLSEEDRQKNLELLEEAKKVSDRFLQRRGRRSTCSLTESPTALSPNPTPGSSPRPSRSSSLSAPSQLGPEVSATDPASPSITQHLEVPSIHDQGDTSQPEQETFTRLVEWMPSDKRKVSSGTLTPRFTTAIPARDPAVVHKEKPGHHGPADKGKNSEHAAQKKEETPGHGISQPPATGVAKPVPRPPTQQAPCTAEIKTIGAFPPLMRAVSWDTVGSMNMRNAAPKGEEGSSSSDNSRESLFKSSGYKDFPAPPGNVQKLSKLREEHKLIRIQSISSSKLPDLSETAEQDRGPPSPLTTSPNEEEAKEKPDAMPNISDVMLRKLKLHKGLPGCAPPLSEKEVENAFVQLSLAFRNDNYTLESRQKQAERERNLTEENLEKELEEFKGTLKTTVSQWQNVEQREFYQQLLETIAVLLRLTNRLSSRAEMVGAVRQEKRMNKATEVMMQYVENLKRTYEKDHAELMEFKKLANQNSNRCYGGSMDTGDEGVPRSSRSMSMQMGKALPRRRVSVAVVPKFNLLNIPGQTPPAGPNIAPGALPVVCETNTIKNGSSSDPTQQDVPDKPGNPLTEQEGEATPTKVVQSPEKITEEIKAKIEEEAYNKGYQEGLKRSKELQELKEEEEKADEKQKDCEKETRGNTDKDRKTNSRFEEALEVLDRIFPKFFRRNRVLWIVLTLFFASFILVNVINFFSNRFGDSGDTSAEKSANPGKKKLFGLNVGSKTPAPE